MAFIRITRTQRSFRTLLSGFADLVDEIGQGFRNPLRILPEFIPFFPWNRNVLSYSLVEYDSLFEGFFR